MLEKEDLEMANHLSGKKRTVLKLSFATVSDLIGVRSDITSVVRRNKIKREGYLAADTSNSGQGSTKEGGSDYSVLVSSSEGLFTTDGEMSAGFGGGRLRVSTSDGAH